mgnify:CR=1 FL=1
MLPKALHSVALARWAGGPGGVADGAGVPQTKDGLPPLGLAQRFAEAPGGAVDFRGELLQLNRALTSAFLDLLDALVAEETETAWEEKVDELRAAGKWTVPTTLALEKATNPFLLPDSADLQRTIGKVGAPLDEVMGETRRLKDNA